MQNVANLCSNVSKQEEGKATWQMFAIASPAVILMLLDE